MTSGLSRRKSESADYSNPSKYGKLFRNGNRRPAVRLRKIFTLHPVSGEGSHSNKKRLLVKAHETWRPKPHFIHVVRAGFRVVPFCQQETSLLRAVGRKDSAILSWSIVILVCNCVDHA